MPVVGGRIRPYVWAVMNTASTSTRTMSGPLIAVATIAGVLVAGTAALWALYGTTVFFEMVRAGIAMCF